MLYRRLRAPLLLAALATLAPAACVIDLDDLPHLGACRGDEQRSERHTIDEPITAVIVDAGVGDVRVQAHAQEGAVVDIAQRGDRDPPNARIHVDDGVMHVSTHCDSGCCVAELSLTIPTAATLEVELGVGSVAVTGLTGAVDLDVGTGDITLDRLAGPLGLHVGTGDIEGHDLSGADAWAESGTGDVSLAYDPAAPLEAVVIEVGVGDVDLRVPEGAYDLRLATGVGDVSAAGLGDQDGADRRIDVAVGTGDIAAHGL
jgi:Putative adhesin